MRKIVLLGLFVISLSYSADLSPLRGLGTENGRFVFGDLQNNDLFMLDTETGRRWKLECNA